MIWLEGVYRQCFFVSFRQSSAGKFVLMHVVNAYFSEPASFFSASIASLQVRLPALKISIVCFVLKCTFDALALGKN